MRRFHRTPLHHKQQGFVLITALAFLFIISTVGIALTQASIQTVNLSTRHSYTQISHIASKAAIDYAKEQFELDASYDGTAEMDLLVNSRYRVTIEVDVLYNEGPSAKRVQAFGRVYIPEISNNADYVRDIKASIIRNGEIIGTVDPSDYNPVLWLDANEPNSLYKAAVANTQYIEGLWGTVDKDLVEEAGSNATSGNRGKLFFSNDDIELSYDGNSRGHQWVGLRYRGINAPKNANINQAYIQFEADETKQSGALQIRVQAVAQDNPGTWNGDYAVSGSSKTTASVTWTPPNWNVVGASGANERVDVTPIVQELVNRSGWTPGNAMAFTFAYVSGSGIRTAEMGNGVDTAPQFYINWGDPAANATANGDVVDRWDDKSLNNNDALFAYGTRPVLQTNAINGLQAIRFSADGALRSALSSTMTGTGYTAFMVMLPRTNSQTDARFLSMMNTSSTTDASGANSMSPFYKDGSTTNVRQRYNATAGRQAASGINGTWSMFSSRVSGSQVERLLRNATPDNYNEDISNVNYSVNEIFVGGTRNGGSGGYRYADMDVAEVVVYNTALTCSQIQALEDYFSQRYSIAIGTKSC